MYKYVFKRLIDCLLAFCGLIILSPLFVILIAVGAVAMKGNPFFVQPRPGMNEDVFNLIKFRTMTCETDKNGTPLPDEVRLTKYGKFLRSTSLDEIPELINIFRGDMAIVGPRPLLVEYLPFYTKEEHRRHDIRPGLTGLAQVNGRNYMTWERKFQLDLEYIDTMSFTGDFKILLQTVKVAMKTEEVETASQIEHDGVIYRPLSVERAGKENYNLVRNYH